MLCGKPASGPIGQSIPVKGEDAWPLLQTLFESSADCLKLVELDGHLSFVNAHGLQLLEINDQSDIVGRQWAALWPDGEQKSIEEAIEMARNGKIVRFEAFCPTATGRAAWWDVTVSPVSDACGQIIQLLSVSREITHRVMVETALKEREAELERLLQRSQLSSGA